MTIAGAVLVGDGALNEGTVEAVTAAAMTAGPPLYFIGRTFWDLFWGRSAT